MAAWDSENKRIAALGAGLGELLGVLPWAAAGFQDLDPGVLVGFPVDIDDTTAGPSGDPEAVNRFDGVDEYGLRPRRWM